MSPPGSTQEVAPQLQGAAPPAVHSPRAGAPSRLSPEGKPLPHRVGPGLRTGPVPLTILHTAGPAESRCSQKLQRREKPKAARTGKVSATTRAAKSQVRHGATGAAGGGAARLSHRLAPNHSATPGPHAHKKWLRASASARPVNCARGRGRWQARPRNQHTSSGRIPAPKA
ncbi:hypothetical protein NDU88_003146 [Pleurodeles waltl]|uniref:Uncharacterized protein n=1 Tax=Pleurodeles waltl TaxID=8319 RepID=A0AAV7RET4_PLEWA|nr:hypothetical protein NDU88_003146 [Pleurodeles waltl]